MTEQRLFSQVDAAASRIAPTALAVKEAAHYIGMSADWLAKSDCPRVRLGRRVLYLVRDLDSYLVQRRDMDAA